MNYTYMEHPTKWWLAVQDGHRTITAWGSRGCPGTVGYPKSHANARASSKAYSTLLWSKVVKGYVAKGGTAHKPPGHELPRYGIQALAQCKTKLGRQEDGNPPGNQADGKLVLVALKRAAR